MDQTDDFKSRAPYICSKFEQGPVSSSSQKDILHLIGTMIQEGEGEWLHVS